MIIHLELQNKTLKQKKIANLRFINSDGKI